MNQSPSVASQPEQLLDTNPCNELEVVEGVLNLNIIVKSLKSKSKLLLIST